MTSVASLTAEEVVRRGKEIYDSRLRAALEPAHTGEWLAIDVSTGEYLLDADHDSFTRRLFEQGPGYHRFLMRVGYPAYVKRGGGVRRVARRD